MFSPATQDLTLTTIRRLLKFWQYGPTCRLRQIIPREVGIPPNSCANGLIKQGGLCYPSCPDNSQAVGPVCWEAYSRGRRTPTLIFQRARTVNRGEQEVELIKSKFQPLTRSEMTQCQTNPDAITIWSNVHHYINDMTNFSSFHLPLFFLLFSIW